MVCASCSIDAAQWPDGRWRKSQPVQGILPVFFLVIFGQGLFYSRRASPTENCILASHSAS
jgi:hypothetical protein